MMNKTIRKINNNEWNFCVFIKLSNLKPWFSNFVSSHTKKSGFYKFVREYQWSIGATCISCCDLSVCRMCVLHIVIKLVSGVILHRKRCSVMWIMVVPESAGRWWNDGELRGTQLLDGVVKCTAWFYCGDVPSVPNVAHMDSLKIFSGSIVRGG